MGEDGAKVTDKATREAVAFVKKYTKNNWSKYKKLKVSYWVLCRNYTYQRYMDKVSVKKMAKYARCTFEKRAGNCYRSAAAFAYVAKVLGYTVRVGVGAVTSHPAPHPLSVHGWTEIKIGKTWYMFDISMGRHLNNYKLFKIKRAKYPYRLRVDNHYAMSAAAGKIAWSITGKK